MNALSLLHKTKKILQTRLYQHGIFGAVNREEDFGVCNIVTPGIVSAERPVPENIQKPDYYYKFTAAGKTLGQPEIKNSQQIACMRESGKLAANILNSCADLIKVGTTTDAIDAFVHEQAIAANAYPSPLRYAGFPKSVCTSVNNVACHGIPDDRALLEGDILNIDITVFLNGHHGDCSKTFTVGQTDDRGQYLIEKTQECLEQCIALCAPKVAFNAIGCYITEFSQRHGLGIIPAFVGHGIGAYFHGPPEILHFKNQHPGIMAAGMTFTIEPILTLGGPQIDIQEDGWTATSVDGARSAQFEHTVLITDDGVEVLTKC